jgi:ATP-binding cassette subfamily B protein
MNVMPAALPEENRRRPWTVAVWGLRLVWSTNAPLFCGLACTTIIRGFLPAALALAIRGLINAAVEVKDSGIVEAGPLVPWLILGFALSTADALSRLANRLFAARLQDDLNLRVTTDVLTHANTLNLAFFEDPRRQDMLTRTQQNLGARLATLLTTGQHTITHLLVIISLLAVLTAIEPLVPLFVAPFALPFLLFQWRLARARHQEEYSRATRQRWTKYFVSKLTQSEAVAEVKLLGLGTLLIERFQRVLQDFRNRNSDLHWRNFRGSAAAGTLTVVALYLAFLRVALRAIEGVVTLGDLAIFGGATARLRNAVDDAIRSFATSLEQVLFVSHLLDFLSVESGDSLETEVAAPSVTPARIELRNVSFTYPGSMVPAIHNVSLEIEPGETLAIVGENGAGKTTVVKLLACLYEPDEGEILFNGVDIRQMPRSQLWAQLGFVFQTFGRYEASVADNIAYGDWQRLLNRPERIEEIAKRTGIHEMVETLPEAYDTWAGRMFGEHTLSGGRWQQVAVARAFAKDSSLLVLDEPTSNLDASAEYQLFCKFKELAQGKTTILISHRFSTLGMADRIAVLKDGQLVEVGTHEQLVGESGVYATLYGLHERMRSREGPVAEDGS